MSQNLCGRRQLDNSTPLKHAPLTFPAHCLGYPRSSIPKPMLEDLKRFVKDGLPEPLACLLDANEQQALRVRAQALADYARFPEDRSGHRHPWPLV